jgi:dimethylhistidine N-methyltransferase
MGVSWGLAQTGVISLDDGLPQFIDTVAQQTGDAVTELQRTLTLSRAHIAPKYFYDKLGSALFTAICELPEYYPTRTEEAILQSHRSEIALALPSGATLIDLGAGDCVKAARLFDVLRPTQYVAVDISSEFVRAAVNALSKQYPAIGMVGLGLDFSSQLKLPALVSEQRRVFFYPGSSIGNFTPTEAARLLRQVRRSMQADGGLLIGVDLVKSAAVLEPAYDDVLGVTATFNLNVLNNVNRLLGANFSVADWHHIALFNGELSRIEMHLEAQRDVTVQWPGTQVTFKAGQRIHTENSYKYAPESFARLLTEAGFETTGFWTDIQGWFAVYSAKPI